MRSPACLGRKADSAPSPPLATSARSAKNTEISQKIIKDTKTYFEQKVAKEAQV